MINATGSNLNTKKLLVQASRLVTAISYLWLALVSNSLLISSTFAAEPSVLNIENSYERNHNDQVPVADSFGRDTPRSTVLAFISALSGNNYDNASKYLNTSTSNNPGQLVRQFRQALDAGGRFHPDLQISNAAEGDLSDQLPPNQERVGSISIDNQKTALILEKVVSDKGEQYWQFSNQTLSAIPTL